jgi:hypothetical protein
MKDLQELLSRHMTRKEFLRLFILVLLSMLGVNNFITMLQRTGQSSRRLGVMKTTRATKGFGSRKFGE